MSLIVKRDAASIDRTSRAGSVALIMVLILVLLVGTYAATVGRRAVSEQNTEYERQSRMMLQSAIEAVSEADWKGKARVRLPLDSENLRWIIVERGAGPGGEEEFQAVFYKNGNATQSLVRPGR